MNSIRFNAGLPTMPSALTSSQPRFEGGFKDRINNQLDTDKLKDKARQYEQKARVEKDAPSLLMKGGLFMMALTLLPGPQTGLLPLGAIAMGAGWLWNRKKGQ